MKQLNSTLVLPKANTTGATGSAPGQEQKTDREAAQSSTVDVEMCIVSRRSIERPGLRYQRRGVNNRGAVANFVETEFITQIHVPQSQSDEKQRHVASYVQTRGSSE